MVFTNPAFDLKKIVDAFSSLDLSRPLPHPDAKVLDLATVDEPDLSEVVSIGMNEFGYIGPSEKRQWLDTYGLAPCIGVQISSLETGYELLMHSAGNFEWQAQELVRYARHHGMITTRWGTSLDSDDLITVYASDYSHKSDIDKVRMGLYGMGCRNIEIATSDNDDSIDVIINSKHERSWINPLSIRPRDWSELGYLQMKTSAFDSSTLHCVNDGEKYSQRNSRSLMHKRFFYNESQTGNLPIELKILKYMKK